MADNVDAFGEELEEKVTCWVCFELMEEPLTLACSHTFCRECCVKVYKKDACCPFCRRPFGLPLPGVNEALRELVIKVRNMMEGKGIKEPAHMIEQDSFLLSLPDEVLLKIFFYLPFQQLCRLATVCQDLYRITDDNYLWRTLCKDMYPFVVNDKGDWKKTFATLYTVGRRFETGKPGDFKLTTMRGHSGYINVFDLYRRNIVSGSADSTLKLWRVTSDKPVHTCSGHGGVITAVRFNEMYIVSGATDNTAKVWDTTTGTLMHTLQHNGAVTDLAFNGDIIVTSSEDKYVRMWDIRQGSLIQSFGPHAAAADHVIMDNNRIISSDRTGVCVWDTRAAGPNAKLYTLPASTNVLAATTENIISGGHDGIISCWNLANGAIRYHIDTRNGAVKTLRVDASRIVSGGNSAIVVSNLIDGKTIRRIENAHAGGVHSLGFDDKKIVSGGADNAVKVWRLNTGESMYALLGGSLQNRGNNQPHPTRPGCSQVSFDETKVIASFSSLLRVYNFEGVKSV